LILTNKKSKAQFVKDKGFKFFVEDRSDIIEEIHHLVEYVFLIDKSWNKDCKSSNIIRVNNLLDVQQYMMIF